MTRRNIARIVIGRLLQALPVILLATIFVFSLVKLLPGDIAVTLAGDNPSDARIAEIRALYGLDQPFLLQYGHWLWNALHGDLSRSLLSGEQVTTAIMRQFPNTLLIVWLAILISLALGVPLGIAAATKPGSIIDRLVMLISSVGVATPYFWLGMLLVEIFALNLGWLPATGAKSLLAAPLDAVRSAILPAMAIAAGGIAQISRQLRASLIDVLSSQFVRTLHAKGLSSGAILWKHGLKNVGVNLLTVTGLLVNNMLAATVVVEAVFAIPGMGNLIVHAAIQRDMPMVQGVILAMVVVVVIVNLVTDLLCAAIDPRIGA
jgi:peptide/nickel transport system permease protein